MSINGLKLTSLLLILPALYSWSKHKIGYGYAFYFLSLTSYIYHSESLVFENTKKVDFWIDQIALWNVVLIGLYYYLFYCKNLISRILVPILCFSCLVIYILNSKITDSRLHMLIHIITIIGHSIIMNSIK